VIDRADMAAVGPDDLHVLLDARRIRHVELPLPCRSARAVRPDNGRSGGSFRSGTRRDAAPEHGSAPIAKTAYPRSSGLIFERDRE
jgi:hypothetical protein